MIYLDLETFLIEPGIQAPPPVSLQICSDDGIPCVLHANPAFGSEFGDAVRRLAFSDEPVVAHNAAFEFVVLLAWARTQPDQDPLTQTLFRKAQTGQWRCTRMREKLIRIAQGSQLEDYALDSCCEKWGLPVPDKQDAWRLRYGELWSVPVAHWPKEARAYAFGDLVVRELYRAQEVKAEWLVDQHRQVCADISLALTSARGIRTDRERAAALLTETQALLAQDELVLLESGLARREKKGVVKNKKQAQAVVEAAYAAQGRPTPRREPTEKALQEFAAAGYTPAEVRALGGLEALKEEVPGSIRVDEEVCLASGDARLAAFTRYSQAATLEGKVKRLGKGLIQARYNGLVSTGRTSCSQGDDPKPGQAWTAWGMQVQNLPRIGGVRECFVARPGHAIVSVDYDAFEMRTWAQVCYRLLGYSALRDILNDPKRCPHVEMGAALSGMSVQAAYALKGAEKKQLRQVAKGPNFGLPGGMGAARLMDYCRVGYDVHLTLEKAQEVCAVWRRVYPEAQPYLDLISSLIGSRRGSKGSITHLVSQRVRGDVGFCDAANSFFQGLAADIAKAAGWRLAREAYANTKSPLFGCRPLVFCHDEWLYEVPIERVHEAGHRMRDVMVQTASEWAPDVLFSASPAAMLRWSKKAGDPCYQNGTLVPYEWMNKES